jgi:hypothetical protein
MTRFFHEFASTSAFEQIARFFEENGEKIKHKTTLLIIKETRNFKNLIEFARRLEK